MKLYRLFLPTIFLLSLSSCTFSSNNISSIDVTVETKSRFEGDVFSGRDFKAVLTYNNNQTKTVDYKYFSTYELSAVLYYPNNAFTTDLSNAVLTDEGNYTLRVNYSPKSNYKFGCYGETNFIVEKKLIPATSLSLESDSVCLSKGSSQQISYSILPNDCTTTPTFYCNDNSVATVDDEGIVTAIDEGQCIISVSADSLKKDCLVTVTPSDTVDCVFTSQAFESNIGTWDATLEGASMDSRQNRGVGIAEETEITSPIEFASITHIEFDCSTGSTGGFGMFGQVDCGSIDTYVGDKQIGGGSMNQANTSFKGEYDLEGESGNVKLVIKPKSNIKIYIRSISITSGSSEVYPTSIQLNGNSSIGIGESDKLTISYNPITANKRTITWSSSAEDVLTVGLDGTIFGVKEGTAKVTAQAKTSDGSVSASFDVNVIKIPVQSIELESNSLEIYEEKTKKIEYTILPHNASDKNVTYESSNTNIATVDASGNVIGMSIGECTITVRSTDDTTIVAVCNISILEKPALTSTLMDYKVTDYTHNNYYSIDSTPSIGKTKLLVIPVWFNDSSTFISSKDNVRNDIYSVYFGSTTDTGWQSIKTYYETESNGKLEISGTVSEWYNCNTNFSTYNYDSGSGNSATNVLVKNATDWYFNNHTSDSRKNYDCDNDGYLDGVILIYGCPDYSSLSVRNLRSTYGDNLWAYTYWLQNATYKSSTAPGPNQFFWASYDFMYSSTTAQQRTGKSAYSAGQNGNGAKLDSHTFIHEMGHLFGLDDYYDYSGYYKPAGGFSMQDYNVGGHDPFSCLSLGWASAYIPIEDCTITLYPFQSSHEVILLSPSWNANNSPYDEYLLLELYTPTGLNKFDTDHQYSSSPQGVSATGIRLWHVDARLIKLDTGGKATSSKTYTAPTKDCKLMMSNTYYSSSAINYISPLGRAYSNYNLLQLIRNSTTLTYQPTKAFDKSSLFMDGDTFEMSKYKKQFVKNGGLLNSGAALGWKFSVSLTGTGETAVASITVNKA